MLTVGCIKVFGLV